jgi:hypothetical protein
MTGWMLRTDGEFRCITDPNPLEHKVYHLYTYFTFQKLNYYYYSKTCLKRTLY